MRGKKALLRQAGKIKMRCRFKLSVNITQVVLLSPEIVLEELTMDAPLSARTFSLSRH